MIEKSNSKRPAYWVGSQVFGSLSEAQRAEVKALLCGEKVPTDTEAKVIDFVIENAGHPNHDPPSQRRKFMRHILTTGRAHNGQKCGFSLWRSDDHWSASLHLDYKWRGVYYCHVWFLPDWWPW